MAPPLIVCPRQAARKLTAHHERFAAGFYASNGGRYFLARVRAGVLEASPDFRTWHALDLASIKFHDHNGRPLYL